MARLAQGSTVVVPPFDCAWLSGNNLQFSHPGRGCVTFEARADNDITLVFKQVTGSKHYRVDSERNYTVVLGSHQNRKVKIEADGKSVAERACNVVTPSKFERYWVDVNDGAITVGKGHPCSEVLERWQDPLPNLDVRFIGLSSWDKHVSYRDIKVLPGGRVRSGASTDERETGLVERLHSFCGSMDFSDITFLVGADERIIHAHRVILAGCCTALENADFGPLVCLPSVLPDVLVALLKYCYTGQTEVMRWQLQLLHGLAIELGCSVLALQVEAQLHTQAHAAATRKSDPAKAESPPNPDERVVLNFGEVQEHMWGGREGWRYLLSLPLDQKKLLGMMEAASGGTDVEMFVDGSHRVQAHRLVLSLWSLPFARMMSNGMKETECRSVCLGETSVDAMMVMLKFMYTGRLILPGAGWANSEEEEEEEGGEVTLLLDVLTLADQYDVRELAAACADRLLQLLSKDNCCVIVQVASMLSNFCEGLRNACLSMCAKKFDHCTASPPVAGFSTLDLADMAALIESMEVCVASEEKVLDAVLTWALFGEHTEDTVAWADVASHDALWQRLRSATRWGDVESTLLPLVRFPFFSFGNLQQLRSSTLYSESEMIRQLVDEAIAVREGIHDGDDVEANASGESGGSMGAPGRGSADGEGQCGGSQGRLVRLPQPNIRMMRRPSTGVELGYISDGDRNGVSYYLATRGYTVPWINPVTNKTLTVTASSPSSRYTDPRVLVSRTFQNVSYAGPCLVEGRPTSWWMFDLGEKHKLMCNYYSIRQDGSTNFMRNWVLQGSSDGRDWSDLRVHKDDHTINGPGQYASWPVSVVSVWQSFRMFRVKLTGPSTNSETPWHLSMCHLELYGWFQ